MPIYSLYCDDCLQEIEIECKISEYDSRMKQIICPSCSSRKVYRNYESDNIYSTIKEVKTLGQLAEKNTKKMGGKLKEEQEKKQAKEPPKPWYHDSKLGDASRKEINKMTPEQKKKYILKGKK